MEWLVCKHKNANFFLGNCFVIIESKEHFAKVAVMASERSVLYILGRWKRLFFRFWLLATELITVNFCSI